MSENDRVSFEDGKYVLVRRGSGEYEWLRHGEPWPVANPPDKKDIAIFHRVKELEALVEEAYREGYGMGWGVGGITAFAQPSDKDQAWHGSTVRASLLRVKARKDTE